MSKAIPVALHHTCFLVRDLEGTAQRLSDALGIGPWNIWTITPAECAVLALPFFGGATCAVMAYRRLRNGIPRDPSLLLDKHRLIEVFAPSGVIWWRAFQVLMLICLLELSGVVISLALAGGLTR